MTSWHSFLDSLATRGGNIFCLIVINVALAMLVYHVLHHNEVGAATATVILSTFSNFTGALMMALTGGSSKQRNGDGNATQPKETT